MYLYQIQENKAEVYEVMLMNVDHNTRGGNLTTVKYWGIYLHAQPKVIYWTHCANYAGVDTYKI